MHKCIHAWGACSTLDHDDLEAAADVGAAGRGRALVHARQQRAPRLEGVLERGVEVEGLDLHLEQRLLDHVLGREEEGLPRLGALLPRDHRLDPRADLGHLARLDRVGVVLVAPAALGPALQEAIEEAIEEAIRCHSRRQSGGTQMAIRRQSGGAALGPALQPPRARACSSG